MSHSQYRPFPRGALLGAAGSNRLSIVGVERRRG